MSRIVRTYQRAVLLSLVMTVAALLIAFSFEDGRFGVAFLAGCLFGSIAGGAVQWFYARDEWFSR